MAVICDKCGRTYQRVNELNRHIKTKHPGAAQVIQKVYPFPCNLCKSKFSAKKSLTFHLNKVHNITNKAPNRKCALCENLFLKHKEVIHHYEASHDISVSSEKLEFNTHDEFSIWKNNIEKVSHESFVKQNGTNKNGIENYLCHRSGYYKSEGKGLRHIKAKGTKKIGAFCPASIHVVLQNDGKCIVNFVKTHIGHKNDLGHLALTKTERDMLAMKIATGIPFHSILDEIRNNTCKSSMERLHLLTRKDLHNIKAAYSLQSTTARHQNDEEDSLEIVEDNRTMEMEDIFETVCPNSKSSVEEKFAEKKEEQHQRFLSYLNSIETEEELEVLKENLDRLQPTLAAVKMSVNNFKHDKKIPNNIKIIQQKRLHNTERKRAPKKTDVT